MSIFVSEFVKMISFAQSILRQESSRSSHLGATSLHKTGNIRSSSSSFPCTIIFCTYPMADKRLHNNNKILRTPKTKITLRRNDDVESGKQAVRSAGGIDDRMLVRCASIAFEVRWMLSFM